MRQVAPRQGECHDELVQIRALIEHCGTQATPPQLRPPNFQQVSRVDPRRRPDNLAAARVRRAVLRCARSVPTMGDARAEAGQAGSSAGRIPGAIHSRLDI